ncbi:hypothetical protein AB0M28_23325 [Streptomyces sp. NPDC051940]|uniref:hypothetical protein n=1 Tax=Streptomyces sp. NPDC051940 TaxID=3155675 RepID=UPI0034133EFA
MDSYGLKPTGCVAACLGVLLALAVAGMFAVLGLGLSVQPRPEECARIFRPPPPDARDVQCAQASGFVMRGEMWMRFTLPADRVAPWWGERTAEYPDSPAYRLVPGLGGLADERGPYEDWRLDLIRAPLTAQVPDEESASVVVDPGSGTVYVYGTWD